MNVIDCKVLEIFSQKEYRNGYITKFRYTSYGRESVTETWTSKKIEVGDIIQM